RYRMPARVLGHERVDIGRNEPEVRGGELPLERVASRIAERHELLQVRELAHVDLDRKVAADRLLQCLAGLEVAAREGPGAEEWLACPLPQQHLQASVSHLQDDCKRGVSGPGPGRLSPTLSTHSRKPSCNFRREKAKSRSGR